LKTLLNSKMAFFVLALIFALSNTTVLAAPAEVPSSVFYGDPNGAAILKNLDYSDVKSSGTWAKEAIYLSGALEIIKGLDNMNRRFGRTDALSKEEALSVAYRAAGREAEAQVLGEGLNNGRAPGDRKSDVLGIWYDGFLQLAANEGMITALDLADALSADQTGLGEESFRRKAPVQRQEMARWLAGALGIEPVRGRQNIIYNFSDWKSADADKIPYIEAVLAEGIINGDGNGRLNPQQPVTREQAAQMIKNAERRVLELLQYSKHTGIVESISTTSDYSGGENAAGKYIDVRSSDGSLHRIVTKEPSASAANGLELVVYANGFTGGSGSLKKGDRIEYITRHSDNTVKYVKVLSNVNEERYMAAQVMSVDSGSLTMTVAQLFKLDYPDIELAKGNLSFSLNGEKQVATYKYGKNTSVVIDGAKSTIDGLRPEMTVILTIGPGDVVKAVQTANLGISNEAGRIVKGIVEENNPQLGYIALFNEDGTGTGKEAYSGLAVLRTYNYGNQNSMEVLRNHERASLDSIQAGDTAYLKLDDEGRVVSISAVDNYTVRYGRIVSKMPGSIAVEYDNGDQQVLTVGGDVLIIRDKKLVSYSELEDGDRVRLLLNESIRSTDLKGITIEGEEHFIANIYKGRVESLDTLSNKIKMLNLQVYNNGKWERTDTKGISNISMSDDCAIYYNNTKISPDNVNLRLIENEAYLAVEKDRGGNERVVVLSFRSESDKEILYSGNVSTISSGSGKFRLENNPEAIEYSSGSIIVKYGRLVSGSSISGNDPALVVANRDYGNGNYKAGVVVVNRANDASRFQIYRARITGINENQDFTVGSFSMLSGNNWVYYNTPKTFAITFGARLLDDDGLINIRNFVDYGENSFINRVVYILADGTDALLLSTAEYGTINAKGTVYEVSGGGTGSDGTVISEPNVLKLKDGLIYDTTTYLWSWLGEMEISILPNTIILKNSEVIKPSGIKKGDVLRVIKKDAGKTGDAYIIIVE
jgi:hypothetical protein